MPCCGIINNILEMYVLLRNNILEIYSSLRRKFLKMYEYASLYSSQRKVIRKTYVWASRTIFGNNTNGNGIAFSISTITSGIPPPFGPHPPPPWNAWHPIRSFLFCCVKNQFQYCVHLLGMMSQMPSSFRTEKYLDFLPWI